MTDAVTALMEKQFEGDMLELYALARARLFGIGPWLARGETYCALQRKLEAMGLWQRDGDTLCPTPLGAALKINLLMVFLGLWDDGEIPMVLEEHGLMSSEEVDEVYEVFVETGWQHATIIGAERDTSTDFETLLKPFARRAFIEHLSKTGDQVELTHDGYWVGQRAARLSERRPPFCRGSSDCGQGRRRTQRNGGIGLIPPFSFLLPFCASILGCARRTPSQGPPNIFFTTSRAVLEILPTPSSSPRLVRSPSSCAICWRKRLRDSGSSGADTSIKIANWSSDKLNGGISGAPLLERACGKAYVLHGDILLLHG